jgi:hypothetical protein
VSHVDLLAVLLFVAGLLNNTRTSETKSYELPAPIPRDITVDTNVAIEEKADIFNFKENDALDKLYRETIVKGLHIALRRTMVYFQEITVSFVCHLFWKQGVFSRGILKARICS